MTIHHAADDVFPIATATDGPRSHRRTIRCHFRCNWSTDKMFIIIHSWTMHTRINRSLLKCNFIVYWRKLREFKIGENLRIIQFFGKLTTLKKESCSTYSVRENFLNFDNKYFKKISKPFFINDQKVNFCRLLKWIITNTDTR